MMVGDFNIERDVIPRSRELLERFDAELARLGRSAAMLRLQVGEALDDLADRAGHHELGFSSLHAYAIERCERGARWAADSRALAARLRMLPVLHTALAEGQLSWSMVELLARHATRDTQQALADAARGTTVRAMRQRLAQPDQVTGEVLDDDTEPKRRCITLCVEPSDAWALELTRMLLRAVTGSRSSDAFVEALLAEGMTTLQTVDPDAADAPIEHDPAATARAEAWRMQLAAWRDEAEGMVEGRVERHTEAPPETATTQSETPATAHDLDARIRQLCSELARRDLRMGCIFDRFRRADGWRRLGWATEEQYARERVGVSHASLKARLTLARRCNRLPELTEALDEGRIGFEAASLVARVASPQTTNAWIDRATERTIKHLREEIEGVEMLARVSGDASTLLPPSDEQVAAVADVERWVLTGGVVTDPAPQPNEADLSTDDASDDSQISGALETATDVPDSVDAPRLRRAIGKVTIRLTMSDELAAQWHDLEERFRRSQAPGGRGPGSFVAFLCVATLRSWSHSFSKPSVEPTDCLDTTEAYAHIYARECFRCKSPVCSARKLTPHHLRFRSQGGSDEDDNVAGLCLWCHLEGIHAGRLRATPPASNIHWTIGRDPVLQVNHRRRIQLPTAEGM